MVHSNLCLIRNFIFLYANLERYYFIGSFIMTDHGLFVEKEQNLFCAITLMKKGRTIYRLDVNDNGILWLILMNVNTIRMAIII